MYNDEIFENALKESKTEDFFKLKKEVKGIESVIEKFLTQMLENTATVSERDYNVCSV
ncbi:hypothetical protein J6G99_08165 [bacterium]|nr:hypothetical protein [bacterium]